ncbi:MAG: CpaF family protein [Proteobacteria bacterium]|nr:CpaF family protein [Burkholderiales bacterium]
MDRPTTRNAIELLRSALAPLAPLFDDAAVTEIMVNAPGEIWVQRDAQLQRVAIALTDAQLLAAVMVLARLSRRDARPGTREGMLDARFDGMRVAACLSPTATRGHALCIRKHLRRRLSLAELVAQGSMTERVARVLRWAVQGRCNLIIAGATDSGKTTFMNALLAEIPASERLVTIEDTPELDVAAPNWVGFEAAEHEGITMRDLVRLALRMRPDRILVGEVRGPEAFDLMQVANTGHRGALATLHANDALGALTRLETLVLTSDVRWPFEAIQRQIAETFDLIVFLVRCGTQRVVAEILRIDGFDSAQHRYLHTMLYRKETTDGSQPLSFVD